MSDTQAKIDQETATVEQEDTDLTTATTTIAAEIAALKSQAPPTLDFSKLDAAMATLDSAIKAQPGQVG